MSSSLPVDVETGVGPRLDDEDDNSEANDDIETCIPSLYNEGMDQTGDPISHENDLVSDPQRVPVPEKQKTLFLLVYCSFLGLYLVFFLVIAYTYPFKPVCHIDNFYLPVFDKISPNITDMAKKLIYVELRFNNRNRLISISYHDVLNVTVYYLPNSTTTGFFFSNFTVLGFYQHKREPQYAKIWTSAPGLSSLMQVKDEFPMMVFRVDLEFGLRFHCRELGKHKHKFLMTADVKVDLSTGTRFPETILMSEKSS